MGKTLPVLRRSADQAAMRVALEGVGPTQPQPIMDVGGTRPSPRPDGPLNPANFVVGQTYPVHLSLLVKSENNARFFYKAAEIDETATSLATNGQKLPLLGYVRDGKVVVFDGQKRIKSSTSSGLPTLDVMIKAAPVNSRDEYEDSRRVNLERSAQTALDDAVQWQKMLANGDYESNQEIAKRLKVSESTVSKTLGINRIPERLLLNMSGHPSTSALSIAYEISNIFGHPKFKDDQEAATILAEAIIEETIKNDLSRKQVTALISGRLLGPKTRVRAESTPVKYGHDKGTLKVFPSRGELDLSFKGLSAARVEELRTRIEQMLGGRSASDLPPGDTPG